MTEADAAEIERLEAALLSPAVRRDPKRLAEILHSALVEFGSSGRVWTYAEVVADLPKQPPLEARISDFQAVEIAPGAVLATYRLEIEASGPSNGASLRSSLWLREDDVWRLRFHQGTPTRP